ncbi:tyrosine-type recombinase/integrase [Cytobacillus sp. FJAT-53684]|uniref:Tyrosine-type recombinase/integrase n=1 Tax=Cytobacillus mangrovibacter TaxID=3299024 RepID=A0ABW6K1E2_9BACI
MNDAAEQLLSEMVIAMYDLFPGVDSGKVQHSLSRVLSKYKIDVQEDYQYTSDLQEKIKLFITAKKVEGLSQATLDGYKIELGLFTKKIEKQVDHITSADIRIYLGSLEGLKMSTIGKKLNVLRTFFGFLAAEEVIRQDPTARLKPPKEEKRIGKSLNIEELEMLRESCETIRQRAFIEVLYATGCRLGEVYGLNKSDINYQDSSCRVIGKGNEERIVYFSPRTMYHLKKYLMNRLDDCEAMFITERRPYRRLSKRGIQDEIWKIAEFAGLRHKVSPHVLRHTFGTLTLNNGAELVAVQELLGHKSPETTLRYARITEERKREQHKKYLVI